MRKFDTKVQYLKYKVLREVARFAFEERLERAALDIPGIIVNEPEPTMRCCIYKERAIVGERIGLAMGGSRNYSNVIEVLPIACDECPVGGYHVTEACRGCIAHRCDAVCKMGAITFDSNQKAHIDKNKCVECGKCADVCPYSAIVNNKRPCEKACKVKAITMDDNKKALINEEKCISCGSCVYMCPFGAISDKSFILDVIRMLKESLNAGPHVYAVVAPSLASQFSYAKIGQVVRAIRELGFHQVVEAALGAELVAMDETQELIEKGFLTSSCCPGFVRYVHTSFPELSGLVSHSLSPMATIARVIKEKDPDSRVVFIGPCTAKKREMKDERVRDYVDSVITFEELQALIDSRDLDLAALPEESLTDASAYGRSLARSGGLTEAVRQVLREQKNDEFDLKPIVCDGIDQCKSSLRRARKDALPHNFIEGMACSGGCIGGAGCLTHGPGTGRQVDEFSQLAEIRSIGDSVQMKQGVCLGR